MRRTILILFVAAAWLVALAPTGTITGGSPDFDHPNAGAIIVDVDWDDGVGPTRSSGARDRCCPTARS